MASSPVEDLERLAETYGRAVAALGQQDIERVQNLLAEADRVLRGLRDTPISTQAELDARQRVVESHAMLTDAMANRGRELLREMQKVRQGRKILQTYGNRSERVGTRLRSQG